MNVNGGIAPNKNIENARLRAKNKFKPDLFSPKTLAQSTPITSGRVMRQILSNISKRYSLVYRSIGTIGQKCCLKVWPIIPMPGQFFQWLANSSLANNSNTPVTECIIGTTDNAIQDVWDVLGQGWK